MSRTTEEIYAICGDILEQEISKNPQRFERINSGDVWLSDYGYIAAIYFYNPLKMTMLLCSLWVIIIALMNFVWSGGNPYWLAALSGMSAFAIELLISDKTFLVGIILGLPTLLLVIVAAIIGGWIGL